ncbi:two component transcriptional regulator, LytTR family [Pedobacter westerhofensis]|uniref:Two component transcriptional regulator, LytTR family n=1 Tax=Pedobacter westerhofensis TaxID=425512 RepID=A0A521CRA4_9SPHI|nr:LytTR family DNA-binding domain-containing protein [Pedobacter westerhofensis]SMO61200.1 two component transcriptional regulator, LytTR family [Pedobacter westerhofensis]
MDKYSCLIVDDEPIARDIIQTYCGHLEQLQVAASCGNALEAKQVLQQQKIDILFLDINMPVMDGISFVKTLKNPPQVIFTTAYKEHAHHAFDLAACDYLLKPFSFDRFIIAVDKAIEKISPLPEKTAANPDRITEDFVFIRTEGKIFKIKYADLLYAEAQGNYTKIITGSQTLSPKMPFTAFEEMLPKNMFLRAHRSFIINKSRISHIEGNRVFINGTEIPIGSNYRDSLMTDLGFSK